MMDTIDEQMILVMVMMVVLMIAKLSTAMRDDAQGNSLVKMMNIDTAGAGAYIYIPIL